MRALLVRAKREIIVSEDKQRLGERLTSVERRVKVLEDEMRVRKRQ